MLLNLDVSSQRKLGVILRYVNLTMATGIGLLLIPFMMRVLGQAEFGLYQLVGSFIGYLTILDFGMAHAVTRYVAKYRAENARQREENFMAIVYLLYLFIGAMVLLVGAVAYWSIPHLYSQSLTPHEIDQAQIMFLILILSLVLSLFGYPMQGTLVAYEQYVFPNLIGIAKIVLRTVGILIVLSIGGGALSIVIVEAVFNVAFFASCTIFAIHWCKVRVKLHHFRFVEAREILFFSFFVFLDAIVDQIFWKMDQSIIGMFVDTARVAVYAIAMQIVTYYLVFSSNISLVMFPYVTQMETRHASPREFTDVLIRTGRIQLVLLGLMLSFFVLFGQPFVHLWAGPDYSDAYGIALIVMIPLTVPLAQNTVLGIIKAKNRHQFRALLYLMTAMLNVPLTIYLVQQFGYAYAAVSTALMLVVGHIVIMNWYYHSRIGIDIPRFFREISRGLLPGIVVAAGLGLLIRTLLEPNWVGFLTEGIIYVIVYGIVLWTIGLNVREKQQVSSPLRALTYKVGKLSH